MKINEFLKSEKSGRYLFICGLAGMILLCLSEIMPKPRENRPQEDCDSVYVQQMEEKLKLIISSVEGAGNTRIMLTLENGMQYEYAREERSSVDFSEDYTGDEDKSMQKRDSTENNYIIIDGKNGREALIEKRIQPRIRGAAILCEGGGDAAVKNEIIQIVTTVLDIPSTKVSVGKLKYDK